MYNIINWKKRPFAYGLIISIGFLFLANIMQDAPPQYYIRGLIVLYLILLFEIWGTAHYARQLLAQFMLTPAEHKDKTAQLVHHLILPSLLFFVSGGFLYFQHLSVYLYLYIALIGVLFSILFTNIRAYYEDKFKLEMLTHNIYDVISIFIVFIATYTTYSFLFYFGLNLYFAVPILLLLAIITIFLVILRLNLLDKRATVAFLAALLAIAIINTVAISLNITLLAQAFINTLVYYYFLAYYNHVKEDTLTYKVIGEYILVFILFSVIIVFIF